MKQKTIYQSPLVLREVSVEMETAILAGSVVDDTGVSTGGQGVGEVIDAGSGSGFNHEWGD